MDMGTDEHAWGPMADCSVLASGASLHVGSRRVTALHGASATAAGPSGSDAHASQFACPMCMLSCMYVDSSLLMSSRVVRL